MIIRGTDLHLQHDVLSDCAYCLGLCQPVDKMSLAATYWAPDDGDLYLSLRARFLGQVATFFYLFRAELLDL